MNQIIDRLLNGEFEYERGSLDFSCSRLELTIEKGETVEGSFVVYGLPDKLTEGRLISSNMRMECLTPEFWGAEEEILYRFHSKGLEEGDVVKGEFFVISNQGEYYLPFVVTVAHHVLESSLGNIKNLFHFANLAKANMEEAVRIFYSPGFSQILTGNDRQYQKVYEGLSKYKGNGQNLEEFLLVINKKQKVEYLVEDSSIYIENPEEMTEGLLTITRNGWGYTLLHGETKGDFLFLEKELLTENDFLGNHCRLPYYVDAALLHAGRNYGEIRLFNAYQEITVQVTIVCNEGHRMRRSKEREKQQIIHKMVQFYLQLRLKKIGTTIWLKETQKLVDRLLTLEDKDIAGRLFQAQLLITRERYNEAKWILDRVAGYFETMEIQPVLYCYYLYLTTLYRREESYVDEIAAKVERIYLENDANWRIAWLLLYLSEEYGKSAQKKWLFLEEQFKYNCTSPVIYAEAVQLLLANPALLMKLEGFEIQVLNFMAKQKVLTLEVVTQIQYLVQKAKEYPKRILFVLEECYLIQSDEETLRAICTVLMKEGCAGGKYFKWYSEAVKKELRITRLYEYYMMSVDVEREEPLPKMVAMYFSYHSDLDYERNACLYANIHKNRAVYPEVYKAYEQNIKKFVEEQILKKHMNRNLAYLYKNLLTIQMINEETAESLASLLFMHQVEVEREDIRRVIVYHVRSAIEFSYPVINGRAQIPLYDSEYTLLFEDSFQNRYHVSVPYTIEKFMLPAKMAKMIAPFVSDQIGYASYVCECSNHFVNVTPENEIFFLQLLASDKIQESYKRKIRLKMIQFYYESDKIRELDDFLEHLEAAWFLAKERGEILHFLVMRGFYEKAYEWIRDFGMEYADAKVLLRLCDRLLEREEYANEWLMCCMVMEAFRHGKYNETLLIYLMAHFSGMTKELRNIWKAAGAFDIDNYIMTERILIQMLYTGSYVGERMEIFKTYVAQNGRLNVELAFLTQAAFDYFVKEKVPEKFVFQQIIKLYHFEEELQNGGLPLVCKLALVKYYGENRKETEEDRQCEETREALEQFLTELSGSGAVLSCFGEYAEEFAVMKQFGDKTIIEYRAHPEAKAILHYMIEGGLSESGEYHTEEMRNVFGGVCSKEFILFFGESLQYYIMEERDGKGQLTESNEIQKSDIYEDGMQSRFGMINDMVISETLQDYDTVDALLEEYYKKEFENRHLFKLSN